MAWRTRLSESGGWVELMLNSTVRVDGTLTTRVFRPSATALMRSGGRLVTMSASPFSSATRRGKSSGIAFQITRAIAGGRPLPAPPGGVARPHQRLVLPPFHEAVAPGPDRAPRQLLGALVGGE